MNNCTLLPSGFFDLIGNEARINQEITNKIVILMHQTYVFGFWCMHFWARINDMNYFYQIINLHKNHK